MHYFHCPLTFTGQNKPEYNRIEEVENVDQQTSSQNWFCIVLYHATINTSTYHFIINSSIRIYHCQNVNFILLTSNCCVLFYFSNLIQQHKCINGWRPSKGDRGQDKNYQRIRGITVTARVFRCFCCSIALIWHLKSTAIKHQASPIFSVAVCVQNGRCKEHQKSSQPETSDQCHRMQDVKWSERP